MSCWTQECSCLLERVWGLCDVTQCEHPPLPPVGLQFLSSSSGSGPTLPEQLSRQILRGHFPLTLVVTLSPDAGGDWGKHIECRAWKMSAGLPQSQACTLAVKGGVTGPLFPWGVPGSPAPDADVLFASYLEGGLPW